MPKPELATPEQVEKEMKLERLRCPDVDMDKEHQAALVEGYKDEICSKCKAVFLAHHHLTTCPDDDCPMKSSKRSLLQTLFDGSEGDVF